MTVSPDTTHTALAAVLDAPDLATSGAPSPFLTAAEAARLAGMSVSNIKRHAGPDGFGFKPGGHGPWRIRRELLLRWLAGEVLK